MLFITADQRDEGTSESMYMNKILVFVSRLYVLFDEIQAKCCIHVTMYNCILTFGFLSELN